MATTEPKRSIPGNPILIDEQAAACLLSMTLGNFRLAVDAGRVPGPHNINGEWRWVTKELRDWAKAGCP